VPSTGRGGGCGRDLVMFCIAARQHVLVEFMKFAHHSVTCGGGHANRIHSHSLYSTPIKYPGQRLNYELCLELSL